MKKINFSTDVMPHVLAIIAFLIVTVLFFNPLFFGNMALSQGDIQQFLWSSKELRDFRASTGEEGLWAGAMFSGMPAYMVNLHWSDGVVLAIKRIMSFYLPHPVNSIFLSFVCYYIMLLAFRVRPYLAIAGALAFGLSSYMIIGLSAGHNSRIGAIAFLPLVIAGIHLTFSKKLLLGFAVTALGMAMHLRESHLQITYYLMMIVGVYGIVQLVEAVREKKLGDFGKTIGILAAAVLIAVGTYFGQFWAVSELSKYSSRGQTELTTSKDVAGTGLPRSYAFEYSNGILEPMTLLIPNFYGGSSGDSFISDENSESYKALVASGDENLANQLARVATGYWGPQRIAAPYYAGAIIVFLFVLGALLVEKKYVWWLVPLAVISIMMSWGSSLPSFNYFLFDYLPGYNKFRSVTFCLVMILFAMPLLGMLGLEKFLTDGITPETKKKLLIAFGTVGGLCLLLVLIPGVLDFTRTVESELPQWFRRALIDDRKSALRSDAFRSLAFIGGVFIMLFFNVPKRISPIGFFAFLAVMITLDLSIVDTRYFSKDRNYGPAISSNRTDPSEADSKILNDKSYYRVYNLQDFYEAYTSNFHNSLGGYSGVRLKRYQELFDSCIVAETSVLFNDANSGQLDFTKFPVLNMLNAKYLTYGNQVIPNREAYGNAWFPTKLETVNSANEELARVAELPTRDVVVIDQSKMKLASGAVTTDSTAEIRFLEKKPYWQKYESTSASAGLGVFSEIHYPKGWTATIDGNEVPIYRVNYVLRALEIPEGKHTIEFTFQPKPYVIGNKVTMAASGLLLVIVVGSLVMELRGRKSES